MVWYHSGLIPGVQFLGKSPSSPPRNGNRTNFPLKFHFIIIIFWIIPKLWSSLTRPKMKLSAWSRPFWNPLKFLYRILFFKLTPHCPRPQQRPFKVSPISRKHSPENSYLENRSSVSSDQETDWFPSCSSMIFWSLFGSYYVQFWAMPFIIFLAALHTFWVHS